jgi:hypothetical protein
MDWVSLEALCNDKWKAAEGDEGRIIGTWCEDGSTYVISCPHQLRPLLIALQNNLYELFRRRIVASRAVSEVEELLKRLAG